MRTGAYCPGISGPIVAQTSAKRSALECEVAPDEGVFRVCNAESSSSVVLHRFRRRGLRNRRSQGRILSGALLLSPFRVAFGVERGPYTGGIQGRRWGVIRSLWAARVPSRRERTIA